VLRFEQPSVDADQQAHRPARINKDRVIQQDFFSFEKHPCPAPIPGEDDETTARPSPPQACDHGQENDIVSGVVLSIGAE
jgi:hypothetical protein